MPLRTDPTSLSNSASMDLVCFMTSQDYMFVSASLLKEVAKLGGDITEMVPPNVATAVYSKFDIRS